MMLRGAAESGAASGHSGDEERSKCKPRILLTYPRDVLEPRFGTDNLNSLLGLGHVVLNEKTAPLTTPQLLQAAAGCQIILSESHTPGEAALFDNAPDLVAFVRRGTDIRNIDLAAASRNGVLVTQGEATFVPSLVEWILAQMINLSRRLFDYAAVYRAGQVPPIGLGEGGLQLAGKTVGLIGLGRTARRLAALLIAMEVRVLSFDPYAENLPPGVELTGLNALLDEADFVVCLAKHTAETERMANERFFSRMKPTAFFINPSRGELVDESALEDALLKGGVAGAALDVGSGPGDQPSARLGRLPNVLATPHVGAGFEANRLQARQAVQSVADILAGRMPSSALNPQDARRLSRERRADDAQSETRRKL